MISVILTYVLFAGLITALAYSDILNDPRYKGYSRVSYLFACLIVGWIFLPAAAVRKYLR